jgi:plasmid stability protein
MRARELTIRDVPDEVVARLMANAVANGRSLQAEIIHVLRTELGVPEVPDEPEQQGRR